MVQGKTVKIIVAAHKVFRMPQDEMYIPLHVGAQGKSGPNGEPLDLGYVKDNTGDNISLKNPGYCELTGLYWAWKNLSSDYIGLAHYRRHFSLHKTKDPFDGVLKYNEIEPYLDRIRQRIGAALFELMKVYNFKEITVTQLAQEAELSRKIFYRLFNDKDDVLKIVFDRLFYDFFF